jgi:hypothetical protein
MTTERKNAISDLSPAHTQAIIDHACKLNPKLHRVSGRAFKAIIGEIGHRDKPDKKFGGHYCDSTAKQLGDAMFYSEAVASDVIQIATQVGVLRTVKRGGHQTSWRRTIDIDALHRLLDQLTTENPHLADVAWYGFWRDKCGKSTANYGALPVPLRDTQEITRPARTAALENGAASNAARECPNCGGKGERHQPGAGWIPCRDCRP